MTPSLRSTLALAAYGTAMRLLVPFNALRVWWRSRREPTYGVAIGERFGFYDSLDRRGDETPGRLWIHAVSLGETRTAGLLVDALRRARPDLRLLLTHGTATGRDAGRAMLRDGDRQAWVPFDTPGATKRFLDRFRPVAGVLMETEIWPHLMMAAQRRGLPMVLVNARLSERSRHRGARVDALLRPAHAALTLVLAQSPADAARLRDAGAAEVVVAGNLKFDATPEARLLAIGHAWKAALGRRVVLFAQSRDGEEAALLAAWARVAAPRPLLVVVPRHPQRFDAVGVMIEAAGTTMARRSAWLSSAGPSSEALQCDVWLGDSMQEMAAYYALADIALLGGSFEPLGGQNLIEAAACGCPIVAGPHTFNFAEATRLAVEAGAAEAVASLADGVTVALACLADGSLPRRSAAALAFAGAHGGATARTVAALMPLLGGSSAAD